MLGTLDFWIFVCVNILLWILCLFKFFMVLISVFWNFYIFGIMVFGILNVWMYGLDFVVLGFRWLLDFWIIFLDFWMFGFLDSISGCVGF